jgi:hypothetical protein
MNRIEYNIIYKGPVIKYLLGGVEDIFGGTKKTTEPLGGYQNLSTIGTEKNYIL